MKEDLMVRPASLEDREPVWQWWNDPLTRRMMKKNDFVPWEEHCEWFARVLDSDRYLLCVGLVGQEKIGVVRFDLRDDEVYEVSINLNPAFRGRGLASPLLESASRCVSERRRVRKLFATLKKTNTPSKKAFAGAGFRFVEKPDPIHPGLERFEPEVELYCEFFPHDLAIHGGQPVRRKKMPPRLAFGKKEVESLLAAVEYYQSRDTDPPYEGHFEREFCQAFSSFMDGGFTDAVATGTSACFVALAALQVAPKSEVIISPVTDSGPLNCIIMQNLVPVVADSAPGSFNMGVEQFLERVTPRTKAVMAVHCAGEPLEIDRLVAEAHARGIRVVEDCSQATGAVWKGRKVGTFGDIAAFSTMYRKNLVAGASSGLVYTRDEDLSRLARAYADRGKQVWRTDLNQNDPGNALFPALNFNTDELSCAIGIASLERLQDTIDKRVEFIARLIVLLRESSSTCRPYAFHRGFSPFFFPIFVDLARLDCTKPEFTSALAGEGIDLNPHYGCVVNSWQWASPYLADQFVTTNALRTRDTSFNLFLNENYGEAEARDVVAAIVKVEEYFVRKAER